MATKVEAFKTSDGKVFLTIGQAVEHDIVGMFENVDIESYEKVQVATILAKNPVKLLSLLMELPDAERAIQSHMRSRGWGPLPSAEVAAAC